MPSPDSETLLMSYFQPAILLGMEPDLPDRTIGKYDIFPVSVEDQIQNLHDHVVDSSMVCSRKVFYWRWRALGKNQLSTSNTHLFPWLPPLPTRLSSTQQQNSFLTPHAFLQICNFWWFLMARPCCLLPHGLFLESFLAWYLTRLCLSFGAQSKPRLLREPSLPA